MDELQITRAENRDQPALHRLWEEAFGDGPEVVEAFFDCFPPEAAGWIARRNGTVCSAAYLLPGNWFLDRNRFVPMGYVYAVATAKAARGRGYAGALMRAIAAEADARGMMVYTRPAEASLFAWYEKHLGAAQAVSIQARTIPADEQTQPPSVQPLSPALYGARREALLAEQPHILLSENFLRLQETYSRAAGGGLFAVGEGLCSCEGRDNTLHLTETVGVEPEAAAQALMRQTGYRQATVSLPGTETPTVAYRGEALPDETLWGTFLE